MLLPLALLALSPSPPPAPALPERPAVIGHVSVEGLPEMDVTEATEVTLDGLPVEWGDPRCRIIRHIRLAANRRTITRLEFVSPP